MTRTIALHLLSILTLLATASVSLAADATILPASEPYTMYYTTNGATPSAPAGSTSRTSATPANYYAVQGTIVTLPAIPVASEVIALVPDAGHKGKLYLKPKKLKIHESRYEFERHVKKKYGERYKIESVRIKQTESGPSGRIYIIENSNTGILQLGSECTQAEWARRVEIARDFIALNSDLIGITENEELRVLTSARNICGNIYFKRYINEYEFLGSGLRFGFAPQFNYTASIDLDPITPEMYAAAQADALPPEEIAKIVYQDLGIPVQVTSGKKPPKLEMRKYLRNTEPYVYWKVAYTNVYEINALTGEIIHKLPNVVY